MERTENSPKSVSIDSLLRPPTPPSGAENIAVDVGDLHPAASRNSTRPPSTTPPEAGISRANTNPLLWPGDDNQPWLQDHAPSKRQSLLPQTSQAAAPGSEHPAAPAPAIGVEGVRILGGRQSLAVETVWNIEILEPQPPDFSIDVELTNGLTITVAHTRKHVDGRWFTVAKDAINRRMIVARFQRHRNLGFRHHLLSFLGSPFAGDVSSLLVLLLATLLALGGGDDDSSSSSSGGGIAGYRLRFGSRPGGPHPIQDAALTLLALLLGMPGELDATGVIRYVLVLALALALFTRLMGKLHERFPPRSTYTLALAPRDAEMMLGFESSDADSNGSGARGWLRRVTSGGDLGRRLTGSRAEEKTPSESLMLGMIHAYKAAVIPLPTLDASHLPSPSGANGGSPSNGAAAAADAAAASSHAGEVDLLVGPLLDAIQKSLGYSDVFGPLMVLAVKNDEGNLRKARKAWEKHTNEARDVQESKRVNTLRGLLETERQSGIHRPGAVLCDPSAAIALLWMRRTLQFLTRCLEGIYTDRPMAEVGVEAYQLELEPFHGWLLKSTFAMALNGFPHRTEIFERLGSHLPEENRDRLLQVEVEQCIEMLKQVVDSMRSLFEELGLENTRKV